MTHYNIASHLPPLNRAREQALKAAVDGKAKPLGALGRLEELAVQIALIRDDAPLSTAGAVLLIFAADHGITAEGVTAYPSEVSALVAQLILDGGAGAQLAATVAGADIVLADMGLLQPLPPHPKLVEARLGNGTANFARTPAMTEAQAFAAIEAGASIMKQLADRGSGIVALGEIGIGNSSTASLVAHAVTGVGLEILTGPGAGAPPKGLVHKLAVLKSAYERAPTHDPFRALCEFGGFEIAALVGAMIEGARQRQIVIVDGFIVTAAACVACAMQPALREYLIFAHRSAERGHNALLQHLGASPLLDLGMRLGEGTGAALAIPIVRMAASILSNMADLPSSENT